MKSYYLFVGIGRYKYERKEGEQGWDILESPNNDLGALAKLLEENYGFMPLDYLSDEKATAKSIRSWIKKLAKDQFIEDENSQLLIYLSCHGHALGWRKKHYWIAHDGAPLPEGENSLNGWVEASDVIDAFDNIPCKHILLISDACFSGYIAEKYKGNDDVIINTPRFGRQMENYLDVAKRKKSRELISSCLNEKTPDADFGKYSRFASEIIQSLRLNDRPELTAEQLIPRLKESVGRSCRPLYAAMPHAGHEHCGSFVFFQDNATWQKNHYESPVHLHVIKGESCLDRSDYGGATTWFREALLLAKTPREKYEAFIGLGRAQTGLEQYEEAIEAFDNALSCSDSEDFQSLYYQAVAYRLHGKSVEAGRILLTLMARNERNPNVIYNLAIVSKKSMFFGEIYETCFIEYLRNEFPEHDISGWDEEGWAIDSLEKWDTLLTCMACETKDFLRKITTAYARNNASTREEWISLAIYFYRSRFIYRDEYKELAVECLSQVGMSEDDREGFLKKIHKLEPISRMKDLDASYPVL
ncbi:caspase family protein [Pontiellaceae bacterium B12227]|nr:caspase family protein [Pontiellaceae bacterium B12227]